MKTCPEFLEMDGRYFHCNRTDEKHTVHENIGTKAEVVSKNLVLIRKYAIQWTVTEMEIE